MAADRVVFVAMGDPNHFQMLRPAITGIARRGIDARVFTHRRLAAEVERAGAAFVDLYAGRPLEALDNESVPMPCRYVSFAGGCAEQLATEVEALGASLIVYETFSVVAWVAARMLGLPYVNLAVGHDIDPRRYLPRLQSDPRVHLSPGCLAAVETLRERHGIEDASPFSYISGISPFLNLHPEPAEFLPENERAAFEPIAYFGCLPAAEEIEARRRRSSEPAFGEDEPATMLYVSFGTIVWRYWKPEALAALEAVADAVTGLEDVRAVIGLGGAELDRREAAKLDRPDVIVERRADQWRALEHADAFLTHHGINSTHEAIFHAVPMISYPFFWDQPELARTCARLGLAIRLADAPLEPIDAGRLRSALAESSHRRPAMTARLQEARGWELRTLAERESVLDRVLGLIGGGS